MRWQKKLTKKQLAHVRKTTERCTLMEFKLNRWSQKQPYNGCKDCDKIAIRLKLN